MKCIFHYISAYKMSSKSCPFKGHEKALPLIFDPIHRYKSRGNNWYFQLVLFMRFICRFSWGVNFQFTQCFRSAHSLSLNRICSALFLKRINLKSLFGLMEFLSHLCSWATLTLKQGWVRFPCPSPEDFSQWITYYMSFPTIVSVMN